MQKNLDELINYLKLNEPMWLIAKNQLNQNHHIARYTLSKVTSSLIATLTSFKEETEMVDDMFWTTIMVNEVTYDKNKKLFSCKLSLTFEKNKNYVFTCELTEQGVSELVLSLVQLAKKYAITKKDMAKVYSEIQESKVNSKNNNEKVVTTLLDGIAEEFNFNYTKEKGSPTIEIDKHFMLCKEDILATICNTVESLQESVWEWLQDKIKIKIKLTSILTQTTTAPHNSIYAKTEVELRFQFYMNNSNNFMKDKYVNLVIENNEVDIEDILEHIKEVLATSTMTLVLDTLSNKDNSNTKFHKEIMSLLMEKKNNFTVLLPFEFTSIKTIFYSYTHKCIMIYASIMYQSEEIKENKKMQYTHIRLNENEIKNSLTSLYSDYVFYIEANRFLRKLDNVLIAKFITNKPVVSTSVNKFLRKIHLDSIVEFKFNSNDNPEYAIVTVNNNSNTFDIQSSTINIPLTEGLEQMKAFTELFILLDNVDFSTKRTPLT